MELNNVRLQNVWYMHAGFRGFRAFMACRLGGLMIVLFGPLHYLESK